MMSTEWVPLSMRTPPPLIAVLEFHRADMSTRDVNAFSKRTMSPRIPEVTIPLARTTSSTYRNFDAMVNFTPVRRAVSIMPRALFESTLMGFSQRTATFLSRK